MSRSLNDYLRTSERANDPDVVAARHTFAQAYAIARQVIELREKHGLTQAELAQVAGITQGQVSRIERGAIAPTTTTLAKIASALGAELRLVEVPG